jgi:hypothetical protein
VVVTLTASEPGADGVLLRAVVEGARNADVDRYTWIWGPLAAGDAPTDWLAEAAGNPDFLETVNFLRSIGLYENLQALAGLLCEHDVPPTTDPAAPATGEKVVHWDRFWDTWSGAAVVRLRDGSHVASEWVRVAVPPHSGSAEAESPPTLAVTLQAIPSRHRVPTKIHLRADVFHAAGPVAYEWDLGDGVFSSQSHLDVSRGKKPGMLEFTTGSTSFVVRVRVTDARGNSAVAASRVELAGSWWEEQKAMMAGAGGFISLFVLAMIIRHFLGI